MSDFVNRTKELKILSDSIDAGIRANMIYSLRGRGKSYLIAHAFEMRNDIYYINVSSNELLGKPYAEDYYYLKLVAEQLCNKLPADFSKKIFSKLDGNAVDISFSLNIFFASIGISSSKKYKILQSAIIRYIKSINSKIYIHIENMQKIDTPSLKFLARLIKETPNVYLYLEYTIEKNMDILVDSSSIYLKFNIKPECFEVDSLDWLHVYEIFKNRHLDISDDLQKEYIDLNGNIKALIFHHESRIKDEIKLNSDEHFLLNLIGLTNANLGCNEIYQILSNYNEAYFKYALSKLQNIINKLIDKNVISELNGNLYVTTTGQGYFDIKYRLLATEILAKYYIPIIESNLPVPSSDVTKGLKILIAIFVPNKDIRIKKLIPYIKKYVLPLNYNKKIVDNLFECIDDASENSELFFCLIQIYISLGCYKEAFAKLEYNYIEDVKYNLLYAVTLIHVCPKEKKAEDIIKEYIDAENSFVYKSSLYTCLVALYMKIRPTEFVINFVKEIYKQKLVSQQDQKIINKNISIYYNYSKAVKIIRNSIEYFNKNGMSKLVVASSITLATRYAQHGKLSTAQKLLEKLSDINYLNQEDLVYIDNNLAVINIYSENISDATYDNLINAYSFLEDEYTKMLAVNNLLVYYIQTGNFSYAGIYAEMLENLGFEKYKFDEYLHLTYMNLLYYYTLLKDTINIEVYINKLKQLKEDCQSFELKKFIRKTLYCNSLRQSDKWYFMSHFNFRAAFMGHWIVNSFDF